ncbi:ATP-dependent RNA helicase vasa-like [Cimex lectularius]|uniref:RNA helicase n=1 Tax=Cimex lectularius TaxID=79782 RepID=A0A8I6R6B6_CIMLE|nr:ATP-dependent RNA helicase vasa-like [Cimex lectularius]
MSDSEFENRDTNTGHEKEKPKERYIPPEPSDDQEVLFGGGISSGINFDKFDNISVKVSGEDVVQPVNSFEECQFRHLVADNLKKSGYKKPTPIQKYAFPSIMKGRDLMACAQTGSGKTAAFLVPIINSLLAEGCEPIVSNEFVEPQAVIISPVRELTIQIFTEARKFAHGSTIKCAIAYGGTVAIHQAQKLMRGCHILVATPGRINDFVEKGRVSFASVRFFVLDEADRMLDMGFLPAIEKMLEHPTMVPVGQRQTLMFSATFPEDIQRLASKYLNNYLFIAVGIVGGACSDVEQVIYEVSKFEKKAKLVEILRTFEGEKQLALVFVEQKRTADFIAAYLSENNFPTTSIHGDRLQSQREQALCDFKSGYMPTLVATAVAARGLDIKNVTHVINYDMPKTVDEYVHRIGRTGRVGNRGKATSFYDASFDFPIAKDLIKILQQCGQEVPCFLSDSAPTSGGFFRGRECQAYGGKDARKFNNRNEENDNDDNGFENDNQHSNSFEPAAQEEEECW